jgi:hypothetical protein
MRRLLSPALLMALVLVGCSGGSKSDSGRAAATPTTAAPAAGAGQSPGSTFSGKESSDYCRLARSYDDASSRLGQGGTPEVRQLFRDASRDVKLAVDVAPPEIRSDVRVVADGFGALVAALESVNYDFTKLPPDLIARFMSQEFVDASTNVGRYSHDVCGLPG